MSTASWVGMLVGGLAVGVTGSLRSPVVGAILGVVVPLVAVEVTRRNKAAGKVREQQTSWTDAVDLVARPVVVPKHSVTALLRPEFEIVPYNNLHIASMRALRRWALSPVGEFLHLLGGGPGMGKTRTARQLARLLQDEEGWRCGIARPGEEAAAVAAAIALG